MKTQNKVSKNKPGQRKLRKNQDKKGSADTSGSAGD